VADRATEKQTDYISSLMDRLARLDGGEYDRLSDRLAALGDYKGITKADASRLIDDLKDAIAELDEDAD
jgi:hypothetical protein